MSEEGGGVLSQLEKFGLSSKIVKGLAGIIGTIAISVTDTGACQYFKAKDVLNNVKHNKSLYKYLPAIIFPTRVSYGYINTYKVFQNPTKLDISKASEIQSILIRHGLVVSTQKNGKDVYLFIGAFPEGLQYTNRLTVAQGRVKFVVKPYKTIFNKSNINPKFGILPLSLTGLNDTYYTNPPISQGGNGFVADVVGIFNYMSSTLYQIWLNTSNSLAFDKLGTSYNMDYDLQGNLELATSAKVFADTPAIHIQFTNILIAPSMSDSEKFNPTLSAFGTLTGEKFNNAVIGSPVYVTATEWTELCSDLKLRGFVSDINVVAEETVVNIAGKDIRISPGLSIGNIINPPNSWDYNDLVSWAIHHGMGLSWSDFDKWVDLALFESEVIQQLIARGYTNMIDYVIDNFDPSYETVEKGVDSIVNNIINKASSGLNNVINFLKSL